MEPSKPRRRGKVLTKEQKQEKVAKDKRLSSAKERILGIKRDVLKIVESMLEENLSTKWFLENCPKLCQQDYDDVIQERSIERVCGYPLCDKPIVQVLKQQYRISRAANKIYDVTERKCFCCNECYKASNYLKAQLSEVPLHLRQSGMVISLHLMSEKENSGSAGEEVVFQVPIKKADLEEKCLESTTTNLSNILKEEVKGFEEHLSKLKITEHTFEKPFVFGSKIQNKEDGESDSESSHSEEEKDTAEPPNFPEYNNISALTNKHMPISETTKKAVLIDPLKAKEISEPSMTKLSVDFLSNVFYDWFSEDTLKYLLGERRLYSMKADLLFQTMIKTDPEDLSSVKNEYVDLCLKIDELPEDEEISDSGEFEIGDFGVSGESSSNRVPKRRAKRTSKDKKKGVSFAPDVKAVSEEKVAEPEEEPEPEQTLPEPSFPLFDSFSQNTLRKQVLMGRLKAVYFEALPIVGLNFRDIRDGVKKMVETFSLTPTNITFKPKEWKCIALVFYKILTENVLKDEDFNICIYDKLCDILLKNSTISAQEITNLAVDLVSSNHVQKLHSYNK